MDRRSTKQNDALITEVMDQEEARLLEVELCQYDRVAKEFPEFGF